MSQKIAIIDYDMGNLQSVYRKLYQLKAQPIITRDIKEILNADKIILPGVGHFGKAMQNIKTLGLLQSLNEAVLINKVPILGICLGMQLMANQSEEGDTAGFGWVKAEVVKFELQNKVRYKVPQTGWNTVELIKKSSLFKGLKDGSEFYFLHAYHYKEPEEKIIVAKTDYEYSFASAIEKENIFGTQFHPEKSHGAGIQLLNNFLSI